ncbi:SRPBCC family protein [Nocardioides maradonensis]
MVATTVTKEMSCSAEHAFDVMVRHHAENHARWEREVLEVRQLDEPGLGARSVMVRHEHGRTREVTNTCVEYVEDRRAAYEHVEPGMDFRIVFDLTPTGPTSCVLRVDVRMRPKGATRLMTPLLALGIHRRSERITARMCDVVIATPAYVTD